MPVPTYAQLVPAHEGETELTEALRQNLQRIGVELGIAPVPKRRRTRKLSPFGELLQTASDVDLAIHLLCVEVLSDATWMERAVSKLGDADQALRQRGESRAQRIERILLAGASDEDLARVAAAVGGDTPSEPEQPVSAPEPVPATRSRRRQTVAA
jgi:hypothetical protein